MKNSSVLIIFILLFMTGCATKGYDGPDLPSSAVSTIQFYSEGRLSFKAMTVNKSNQGYFDSGVKVPAGNVDVLVEYQLAMHECPMYSIGCFDEVDIGQCAFTFKAKPEREYSIRMRGAGSGVSSEIIDEDSDEQIGSGSCVKTGDAIHNSVLRKRSTVGKTTQTP